MITASDMRVILRGYEMDIFDQQQIESQNKSTRLMSQATSLELAQQAYKVPTHSFNGTIVTEDQVRDEMLFTMMNCTTIKPCGE